jgi:hypothetical protein
VKIIGAVQLASAYQSVKIAETIVKIFLENFSLKWIMKRIMTCPSAIFSGCSRFAQAKGREFSSLVFETNRIAIIFATYSRSVVLSIEVVVNSGN